MKYKPNCVGEWEHCGDRLSDGPALHIWSLLMEVLGFVTIETNCLLEPSLHFLWLADCWLCSVRKVWCERVTIWPGHSPINVKTLLDTRCVTLIVFLLTAPSLSLVEWLNITTIATLSSLTRDISVQLNPANGNTIIFLSKLQLRIVNLYWNTKLFIWKEIFCNCRERKKLILKSFKGVFAIGCWIRYQNVFESLNQIFSLRPVLDSEVVRSNSSIQTRPDWTFYFNEINFYCLHRSLWPYLNGASDK